MNSLKLDLENKFQFVKNTLNDAVKSFSFDEIVVQVVETANIFQYIGSTFQELANSTKNLRVIGGLKLMTLGTIPLIIYETFVTSLQVTKFTINEKIDFALNFFSNGGLITGIATNVAEGLSAVGIVARTALGWLPPVSIAATAIEGIGLIFVVKSMFETHLFSQIFNKTKGLEDSLIKCNIKNYKKIRKFILINSQKEKSFIYKHFRTSSQKMNERLYVIEFEIKSLLKSGKDEDKIIAEEKLKSTMQLLSKRLSAKKWSNALSMLIFTINIVGFGLLFSPVAPLGFSLMGLGCTASLVNFFWQKIQTNRFEKALNYELTLNS